LTALFAGADQPTSVPATGQKPSFVNSQNSGNTSTAVVLATAYWQHQAHSGGRSPSEQDPPADPTTDRRLAIEMGHIEPDLSGGSNSSALIPEQEHLPTPRSTGSGIQTNLSTRYQMELYASGGNREKYVEFILLYYYCIIFIEEIE